MATGTRKISNCFAFIANEIGIDDKNKNFLGILIRINKLNNIKKIIGDSAMALRVCKRRSELRENKIVPNPINQKFEPKRSFKIKKKRMIDKGKKIATLTRDTNKRLFSGNDWLFSCQD